MCSDINEKSSLKTIRHCSPHLQLWFSGSEIVVFATWPIDLRLLKYFGTSKKFLRTSGFYRPLVLDKWLRKKFDHPWESVTNGAPAEDQTGDPSIVGCHSRLLISEFWGRIPKAKKYFFPNSRWKIPNLTKFVWFRKTAGVVIKYIKNHLKLKK